MKLFDKIVKDRRAYGIGESLAYANGVPMARPWHPLACPLAYLWRSFGVSMTYLSRIHGSPLNFSNSHSGAIGSHFAEICS